MIFVLNSMTQPPQQDILDKFDHVLTAMGIDRNAPRGERFAKLLAIMQARLLIFGDVEGDYEWLQNKVAELESAESTDQSTE